MLGCFCHKLLAGSRNLFALSTTPNTACMTAQNKFLMTGLTGGGVLQQESSRAADLQKVCTAHNVPKGFYVYALRYLTQLIRLAERSYQTSRWETRRNWGRKVYLAWQVRLGSQCRSMCSSCGGLTACSPSTTQCSLM